VSCKVTSIVAGASLSQAMRCAGTDYKFNTSSKLTYSGGKISASWSETTYDASGSVSGSAVGNTVHAVISGDKFSGRMSINVSGSRHTINIVQLDPKSGTYRPAASVALHRLEAFSAASAITSSEALLDRGRLESPRRPFSLPFPMPAQGVAELQQSPTNFPANECLHALNDCIAADCRPTQMIYAKPD
jgi:hypothetical protein